MLKNIFTCKCFVSFLPESFTFLYFSFESSFIHYFYGYLGPSEYQYKCAKQDLVYSNP